MTRRCAVCGGSGRIVRALGPDVRCGECGGSGDAAPDAAYRDRLERAGQQRLFGAQDRCWCGDAHRVHPQCTRHGDMRRGDLFDRDTWTCGVCGRRAA